SKQLGQMLPELYLHGLAKGDFELALRGLLGKGAPLSKGSIQRLKAKWQLEYEAWKSEDLSDVEAVYMWADGLYVKAGIADHKAAEKLLRDWDRLVTFFDFPQEHWTHLRTTNIVESPFSAIRLRTDAARRHQRVENATALIWKLLKIAEKQWRTFKGFSLLKD